MTKSEIGEGGIECVPLSEVRGEITDVFLVKSHSWDYDFHDDVIIIYPEKSQAVAFLRGYPTYNKKREEGMLVERWTLGTMQHETVYYAGDPE